MLHSLPAVQNQSPEQRLPSPRACCLSPPPVQDFKEKNLDLMRPDVVMVLKSSSVALVRELVGADPVAVFRWAILRAFFRSYHALKRPSATSHVHPGGQGTYHLPLVFSPPGQLWKQCWALGVVRALWLGHLWNRGAPNCHRTRWQRELVLRGRSSPLLHQSTCSCRSPCVPVKAGQIFCFLYRLVTNALS